jgi:hypothetical protein
MNKEETIIEIIKEETIREILSDILEIREDVRKDGGIKYLAIYDEIIELLENKLKK